MKKPKKIQIKKKINKNQTVKLDSGATFIKTPKKSTKIYMR